MLIDELLRITEVLKETRLAEGLLMAQRFQIDNVAQYCHQLYDKDKYVHIEKDIPNMAPLAPVMWFEYNGRSVDKPSTDCYGCLISIDYDRNHGQTAAKWEKAEVPDETQWILRAEYWGKYNGNYTVCDWLYYFLIGDEGNFIGPCISPNPRTGSATPEDHIADEYEKHKVHAEILTSLFAICFAHCKGTAIEEHQPTRQVRRASERSGTPVFTFHTIDIQPSTSLLQTEGDISKNGLAKALHICRGHFAHYTEDKPLFGKYTGTFYRPMHTRGRIENGITAKDYNIHP